MNERMSDTVFASKELTDTILRAQADGDLCPGGPRKARFTYLEALGGLPAGGGVAEPSMELLPLEPLQWLGSRPGAFPHPWEEGLTVPTEMVAGVGGSEGENEDWNPGLGSSGAPEVG